MESSRDSSVWQTLAVTFGGGLALGAVGMKLTQNVRRPPEDPPPSDDHPVDGRLAEIEQRLARVEHAPAPTPSAQLDRKVLEAIIGAVDVKLQEQSLKLESRIAALEARMTVDMDAMRAENTTTAGSNNVRIKEVESQFLEQMLVLRTAVVDELNHFGEAVSTLIGDQVSAEVSARAISMEQNVEARVGAAAAAAVAASVEESLAPLRAEAARKERELIEVQSRLRESEKSMLDVILAIGQVCRQAADRMNTPSHPSPGAPSDIRKTPEPAAPKPIAPIAPAPPAPETTKSTGIEPPDFTQRAAPSRLWRIPLVSSLLISTTGLVLLHYL
jgi:hypothetical protein